ncbi:MAG TPA: hypothetical protein DEP84_15020, partial [Chloroflexi bacterium]|nr:hypothetical protein [Chloroflexota bacterium]
MTRRLFFSFVLLIVVLAVPLAAFAQMTPAVSVSDQEVKDGTVTVAKTVATQDGWMVIHKDQDGNPGPVIGFSSVKEGENENVQVKLNEELTGPTKLWAMLHVDEGTKGTYEFPGADVPAKVDDKVVMEQFTASPAGTAVAAPATLPTTG